MVGGLIDLETENTMLHEDLKNCRDENKYLKERIAKFTLLIQNKIEELERTSVRLNEKEDGAQKSLEPLVSLEETSVQPSAFASMSIALKENEDLDKKSIGDIIDDIMEGKMVFEDVDTEKDRECFKRGLMKLNVLAKRREEEFSSASDQPQGTLTPPIKKIRLADAMAMELPELPAIQFDISDEEVETEPLSEVWGITGDTEVWNREDRI